VGRSHYFSRNN